MSQYLILSQLYRVSTDNSQRQSLTETRHNSRKMRFRRDIFTSTRYGAHVSVTSRGPVYITMPYIRRTPGAQAEAQNCFGTVELVPALHTLKLETTGAK